MTVLSLPNIDIEIDQGGERMNNGGFETNDFTGWVTSGQANISTGGRTGTYMADLYDDGTYMQQNMSLYVDQITAFSLYYKGIAPCPAWGEMTVTVTYSDDTTLTFDRTSSGSWQQLDIYPSLTAGKLIVSLKIEETRNGCDIGIDDVTITGDFQIQDETILGVGIHLGCTMEVSSFDLIVDRGNPDYDNALDPNEGNAMSTGKDIEIYLGRGSNKPLLLTGKVEEVEYIDEFEEFEFRNVVRIRGRCNGHQIFDRKYDGDLNTDVGTGDASYRKATGEAESLVAYLIDNYTNLSHSREEENMASDAASGQKNVVVDDGSTFAAGDLVKVMDDSNWEYHEIDSIASNTLTMLNNLAHAYTTAANGKVQRDLIKKTSTTYTQMQFAHTTIFEILKFIAETADLSGAIGYDFRIEYDAEFAFFSKTSQAESYSLQDECQFNRYILDASRIKNKVTVFGKDDKPYPLDSDGQMYSDAWTENFEVDKSELIANAAAAATTIEITNTEGSLFAADDYIWITDNDFTVTYGELKQIDSIGAAGAGPNGGDVITLKSGLARAYNTADFAICFQVGTDGGWGFEPLNSVNEVSVSKSAAPYEGSWAVGASGAAALLGYNLMFVLQDADHFSMNDYPTIKIHGIFVTTAPTRVVIQLLSGDCEDTMKARSNPYTSVEADAWVEMEFKGGTKNAGQWVVSADFDWDDIKVIEVYLYYAAAGAYVTRFDRLHAFGKRWGGGTNDANSDGFAEDTSSQTTYGTKELVVISELLLSDAECEAKAQALIDYYASERTVIEVSSDTLDWTTYHPMAGNTVAADLDEVGVTGSSYRIDSIDIVFRSANNTLTILFALDKTPIKAADYLYKLSERLRQLERKYENVR